MLTLILVVVVGVLTYYLVSWDYERQLKKLNKVAEKLSSGELSVRAAHYHIGHLSRLSGYLLTLRDNMAKAADFAEQIGDGKDCQDLQLLGEKDKLGHSLIGMRNKLKEVAAEDSTRSWVSEGVSIVADILRHHHKTAHELGTELLQHVVEYVGGQQGAIYTAKNGEKDGDTYLELAAGYAYDSGREDNDRIAPGDGLIGQAFLGQETMVIADVPEDHIKISSGLIDGVPRHLLILPLVFNDVSEGVIEIASYQALETYKVEFLKRISENIASTLATLRNSEHTKMLLEQSRKQAQKLQLQENTMLRNQRKLEASQQEMLAKQAELSDVAARVESQKYSLTTLINNTEDKILSLDSEFNVKLFNNAFAEFFGTERYAVAEGQNLLNYLKEEEREEWKVLLKNVMNGVVTEKEYKFSRKGSINVFDISFSLLKDKHTVKEISVFFRDITEYIRKNERIRRSQEEVRQHSMQLEHTRAAINRSGVATAEYDMEGYLLDANEAFLKILGIEDLEPIIGKHHSIFVPEKDVVSKEYELFWEALRRGESNRGQYERVRPDGTTFWINGSYNVVREANGKPVMVVKVAVDVTENVELLHKTVQQARDLKKSEKEINRKLEEIQDQQRIHQAILHGCVDGVISFDQDGYVTFVNKAAAEMIGRDEDGILGRKLKTLIPIDIVKDKYEHMSLLVHTHGEAKEVGIRTEATFPNKLGDELDVLLTASITKMSDGHHFTIFIQNISVDLF